MTEEAPDQTLHAKKPGSEASPKDFGRLLEELSSPTAGLLASGGAFLTGVGLLMDDARDFGLLDTPDHPSPLHHWLIGVLAMLGGVAGMGFNLLRLLYSNPNQLKAQLPRSLVEGLPPELVDRYR